MNTTATQRNNAKQALFEALKNSDGDSNNELVVAAIEKLAALNPNSAPTEGSLLEGSWLLINAPSFPGRQSDSQGRYIYTLGRLSFNMFEPAELLVEIEQVLQPVFPTGEENERTHDIIVKFRTIDARIPELKGIVKNLAVCSPKSQDTLQVKFVGGELMPLETKEPAEIKQWLQVFDRKEQKSQLSLWQTIKFVFIKWMFGISKASDLDFQTGKRAFTMKKSPKGLLKVIYLDDELRITRGNRETVLICQRVKKSS